MGHVGEVWVFQRSGLCGEGCLRGTWGTLKRKLWREGEERVFRRRVSVWKKLTSKREKRESRVEEALMEFDMHVCKRRRSVQKFPPKCPTRRRFGDQVSYRGKTLDRPILSFFFSFLFANNLNINKWAGSFKTNSPFAYFNFIKMSLVGQLVSGFQ